MATAVRRPAPPRAAAAPPVPPAVPAPPAPPAPAPEVPAAVAAALIRTVQSVVWALAGDIGRGDVSPNAALVRLGADRDDVETLRGFLAAQPGFSREEP